MTTKFDPHTIIRELAETERPCPCVIEELYPQCSSCTDIMGPGPHSVECRSPGCFGTGHTIPFASLRVTVQRGHSHRDCMGGSRCLLTVLSYIEIRDCGGRGWIPEPNVKVAAWQVLTTPDFAETGQMRWWKGKWYFFPSSGFPPRKPLGYANPDEALLRAAQAWLEKKQETP